MRRNFLKLIIVSILSASFLLPLPPAIAGRKQPTVSVSVHFERASGGDRIIRQDEQDWATAGFGPGQIVVVSGSSVNNGTYSIATSSPSTLVLEEANRLAATTVKTSFSFYRSSESDTSDRDKISRNDGRDWEADGFESEQSITVSEAGANSGTYTIESVNGTQIALTQRIVLTNATTTATISRAPVDATLTSPIAIDGSNPKNSRVHTAIPATAIWTTTPAERRGPFYVGDVSTGEVGITEFTVPGFLSGDPQLSWARCNSGHFAWCDTMEVVLINLPSGRPWQADIYLSWPGKERVDPETGKTTKLNNLDFYFLQDQRTVYVFENSGPLGADVQSNEVEFTSGVLFRGSSRTNFHPEQLTLADIPATGQKVPQPLPDRVLLGGPTVLEQNGDFGSTPTCPNELRDNAVLQPKLCPKITEVYRYYHYYLLVLSRTHSNEAKDLNQVINKDVFNQGYTISTNLDIVPEDPPEDPGRNFIAYDQETDTFFGGLTPEAAKEEGIPPVKQPGADGPPASHELFALKGATSEPQQRSPIVPGAIAILAGGVALFLGFKFWGRRRATEI